MDEHRSYFSHDSNARNDAKIIRLRQSKDGLAKYGVYWMLVEKLRESKCYMLEVDYNGLAWEFRSDNALIKSVIEDFGLFDFTEDRKCFYSTSLLNRMKLKEEKSEKARESANKRWLKNKELSEDDANALPPHSESNAIKQSKAKERKELLAEAVRLFKNVIAGYSDSELQNEANKMLNKYGEKEITNMGALVNKWAAHIPKKEARRVNV